MSRLKNVNVTDIQDAVRLGCGTMQNIFNADDDQVPFMGSCVWLNPRLGFSAYDGESPIPGRRLNALLNAEHAAGITLDEIAIEKHWSATASCRRCPGAPDLWWAATPTGVHHR